MKENFEKENFEIELDKKVAEEKFKIIQHKVHEHRIAQVWKKFEAAGFKPLLIKGWVTARKYPKPFERTFVDFDLVFSPQEFKSALNFKENNSFEYLIDLHNGVRHLDSLSFEDLYQRAEIVEFGEVKVKIPCEEDHLRIICVHWLNDGGEYKDKLWDLYYAIENRKNDFDWEKCLSVVDEKRRRWIVCAIGVAHKYLELDLKNTPIENEAKKIPKWLINTLEKEWRLNTPLKPIQHLLSDRKELWIQIKKRFPPNPIQATIEVNGHFDKYPRIIYQGLDIFKRLLPSIKRLKLQYFTRSL